MKIFGVSLATILLLVGVAILVRAYGSQIPLLNNITAG